MTAHRKKHEHAAKSASEATLRDYFAVAALQALCHLTVGGGSSLDVAERAYVMADAMLAARDEPPPAGGEES